MSNYYVRRKSQEKKWFRKDNVINNVIFFLTVNASDHLEGFPEVSTTEIAEIYRGMVSVEKKMLTVKSS